MPPRRRSTKPAGSAVAPVSQDPIAALAMAVHSGAALPDLPAGFKPARFHTVRGTIKGGVAERLAPCTAFVGENRAGKSRVLDTIRIAFTGKHAVGTTGGDLLALSDGKMLLAEVVGDDVAARVEIKEGTKTPEVVLTLPDDAGTLDPELFFPLSSIAEVALGHGVKARSEFFARFGSIRTVPTPGGVTPEQLKLWEGGLNEARTHLQSGADPAETLAELNSVFRSRKLKAGRDRSALERDLNTRRAATQGEGTSKYTPEALTTAAETLARVQAWAKAASVRKQLSDAQAELAGHQKHREELLKVPMPPERYPHEAEAQAEIARRQQVRDEYRQVAAAARQADTDESIAATTNLMLVETVLIARKESLKLRCCITCGRAEAQAALEQLVSGAAQAVESLRVTTHRLAEERAERAAARDRQAAIYDQSVIEIQQALAQATREQAEIYQRSLGTRVRLVEELQQKTALVESLTKAVDGFGAGGDDPALTEEAALAEVRRLEEIRDALAAVDKGRASIRLLETDFETYRGLERIALEELQQVLATAKTSAENALNKWMAPGFKATLVLHEMDGEAVKPVYRWEVVGSDGVSHRKGALAGSERTALIVAMACAWTDGLPVRILLLDDLDLAGFSPRNLKQFLSMIAGHVAEGHLTQAIAAWSRDEFPPEWYVRHLDAPAAPVAAAAR